MLGLMGACTSGEVLGLDFETTGIDRFEDVPVSYALVSVVDGVLVRSWSGLIDPGREIPADATEVHGITTERARAEGMPLEEAIGLVADAVVAASRRGAPPAGMKVGFHPTLLGAQAGRLSRPLAGMKLDFDLTLLDAQAVLLGGRGLVPRGWHGPVLDAGVLDRHFDPDRHGRRTLGDLCAHYGIPFENAHDASADAIASVQVLFALAERFEEVRGTDLGRLHAEQILWHRAWTEDMDDWRVSQGMIRMDPRDFVWPVAPAVMPPAARPPGAPDLQKGPDHVDPL